MTEITTDQSLAMLAALAQETRLEAFRLLVAEGPDGLPAGDVARIVGVPSNTMSTPLAILERAGLIASQRSGRSIVYSARLDAMKALVLYLVQDCCKGQPGLCGEVAAMLDPASSCARPETQH